MEVQFNSTVIRCGHDSAHRHRARTNNEKGMQTWNAKSRSQQITKMRVVQLFCKRQYGGGREAPLRSGRGQRCRDGDRPPDDEARHTHQLEEQGTGRADSAARRRAERPRRDYETAAGAPATARRRSTLRARMAAPLRSNCCCLTRASTSTPRTSTASRPSGRRRATGSSMCSSP